MTLKEYFRISRKFGLSSRNEAVILTLLIFATGFEGIGIGMLLPIVEFIRSDGDTIRLVSESQIWANLIKVYDFFGITPSLAILIGTSFVAIATRQCFSYIRQIYLFWLAEELVYRNRNLGFQLYLEADTQHQERERTGGIVNSLTTELRLAIDALFIPVMIASFTINLIVYIGIMLFIAGPIAVVAIGTVGAATYLLKRLLLKTLLSGEAFAAANEGMSSFLVERLSLSRLVRLAGTEDAESAEMRRLTGQQRESMMNMRTFQARVDAIMEPLAIGIGFAAIYLGVSQFEISIEELGVFAVIAMMRLLPIAKEIVRSGQSMLAYQGSIRSFERRLDKMVAAQEHAGGNAIFKSLDNEIRFENVSFSYNGRPEVPALRDVDLSIKAFEMTAIVGPSGSGKSTLLDLLPRLRDPTKGSVCFDNRDIREFSVTSLRSGIAYASQRPLIFDVTIAEQIRYGKPDATMEEIRTAAELAGATEFIEVMPDRYNTKLGQDGVRISGGQQQRLDLARALIKSAPILILDEPTSNLDASAEEIFRATLRHIRKSVNATVVVVAHRLSTISEADKIVTLQDGHITDIGTHRELMAKSGWYATAYANQRIGISDSVSTATTSAADTKSRPIH